MTPILCARAVVEYLKRDFANYTPTDEKMAANDVVIRDGFLPKSYLSKDATKHKPYVIVRPVQVKDEESGHSGVSMQILVFTYNQDTENGHLELYNMMERIRQALLKKRTIGDMFRLSMPVISKIPEEQPYPNWWGYLLVDYGIAQPQEIQDLYYE